MNWEYKKALDEYKPTLEEHLVLKKVKPTLNALIQYADDYCIVEVGLRTIAKDLCKRPNTISEHVQILVSFGFVEILDIKGNFGKKNLKKLTLPNVSENVTENVTVNVTNDVSTNVTDMTDTEERKGKKGKSEQSSPKGSDVCETEEMKSAKILAEYLKERILEEHPTARVPKDTTSWAKDIEKMIRIDGRDKIDIQLAIEWVYLNKDGDFWKSNIRSGKKLREKYDTLYAQSKRSKK